MVLDKSGMYEVLENVHEQITNGWMLAREHKISNNPSNICILGMGGSALGGYLLQQYLEQKSPIPVFVIENYQLPEYITKESFVFIISYSGNTEETIDAFLEAKRRKIPMICVSVGGKLKKAALSEKIPHITLNQTIQPRLSVFEQFFVMLKVLQNSNIVQKEDEHVNKLIKNIKESKTQKIGEALAEKIHEKTPMIYSSQKLFASARVWKACFNENAKTPAFTNYFPALNHNEFESYEYGTEGKYMIIMNTNDELAKMQKRINLTKEFLEKRGAKITQLAISGDSYLTKLMSATLLGEWTAYFLAIKKGIDPSPVTMVEEFKKKLEKY